MTPAQRETLEYIHGCRERWNFSPSFAEIAFQRRCSVSSAREMVGRLVQAGYLLRDIGKARSVRLTEKGRASVESG